MVSVNIDERGLATLGIADAAAEVHEYRFLRILIPPHRRAIELTRTDTDARYTVVIEEGFGKITCDCPAEKYRKRGQEHCKHIAAVRAFQAWYRSF